LRFGLLVTQSGLSPNLECEFEMELV